MKLLKILTAFLLLVSLQIATAQWLNVPPPVEARGLMMVGGGVPVGGGGTDTVGFNTAGSSSYGQETGTLRCYAKFTADHTGTLTNIEWYSEATTEESDVKLGVYTDSSGSPNAIVGTETEFTNVGTWSVGWHSFGAVSYAVTASSSYWLCGSVSPDTSGLLLYYNSAGTNSMAIKSETYTNAWPATLTEDELNNNQYSVRGTVTY